MHFDRRQGHSLGRRQHQHIDFFKQRPSHSGTNRTRQGWPFCTFIGPPRKPRPRSYLHWAAGLRCVRGFRILVKGNQVRLLRQKACRVIQLSHSLLHQHWARGRWVILCLSRILVQCRPTGCCPIPVLVRKSPAQSLQPTDVRG